MPDLATENSLFVPGCEDHPVQSSSSFGASTVNDSAEPECNKDALSGVPYNVFSTEGPKSNVYDKFCQDIEGTTNSNWTVDAHGDRRDAATPAPPPAPAAPSRAKLRRTPPSNPDKYDSFRFELSWAKDDAGQGCGQTVASCRNAFARLAASPCGRQGGQQNTLAAAGRIALKGCGTYAYRVTGPKVPPSAGPAPPSPPDQPPSPPPPPPPSSPDMSSPACMGCSSAMGASSCEAADSQCLVGQCKADKSCQDCKVDCNSFVKK